MLGVSKQSYYKRDLNFAVKRKLQEEIVVKYIGEVRDVDHKMGIRKMWVMYRQEFEGGEPVGRDIFEEIAVSHGFKVRKKTRKPRTTDSRHGLPTYPNLIRSFNPTAKNQLWVSDITYIKIWLGQNEYTYAYLSLLMDGYSREILGWSIGPTLETIYPLKALRMALETLAGTPEEIVRQLIHHSDRGVQYASSEYVKVLNEHHIRISMTENGDPKENPQAERINGTVKNELMGDRKFHSIQEVEEFLASRVAFYNERRPHMSLNNMTPRKASQMTGEIKKKWTSYRDRAIKGLPAL